MHLISQAKHGPWLLHDVCLHDSRLAEHCTSVDGCVLGAAECSAELHILCCECWQHLRDCCIMRRQPALQQCAKLCISRKEGGSKLLWSALLDCNSSKAGVFWCFNSCKCSSVTHRG